MYNCTKKRFPSENAILRSAMILQSRDILFLFSFHFVYGFGFVAFEYAWRCGFLERFESNRKEEKKRRQTQRSRNKLN